MVCELTFGCAVCSSMKSSSSRSTVHKSTKMSRVLVKGREKRERHRSREVGIVHIGTRLTQCEMQFVFSRKLEKSMLCNNTISYLSWIRRIMRWHAVYRRGAYIVGPRRGRKYCPRNQLRTDPVSDSSLFWLDRREAGQDA